MLERRSFLRGLVAAPAVVAFGSLMPIRGIVMPVGLGFPTNQHLYDLVRGLTEDGIWDKLDRLWVFDGRPDQLISIR